MTKLGRARLAGLAAGAAKKATSVPKTATRSMEPLAAGGQGPPTHQGWDSLQMATPSVVRHARCRPGPDSGVVDGRKASDAEVMAMTEAMVTFKEVLTDDRTLLTRRKS